MNWKKFKNTFKIEDIDETCFILGIDIGNETSSISYFDVRGNSPEIIDVSGGYGKPSVPTVMQYVYDTKEWVYGEYAVLNSGTHKDITLTSIFQRLGKKDYIEIGSRTVYMSNILGLYIKDLVGNVKNINPNAEIAGMIVSSPSYLYNDAKEELTLAFKYAGFDKELIGFVTDRECVLNRFYFENPIHEGKILMLDFGSREVRGGVLDVSKQEENISIQCASALFDESVSTKKIDDAISELLTMYYCKNFCIDRHKLPTNLENQIKTFAYQHRDLLFQKTISLRPVRLYFNFAYPPFQQNVTKEEMSACIEPFKNKLISFIDDTVNKKFTNEEIDTVICTGGGFEMLWAKQVVSSIFPNSQMVFFKNAKAAISEGAAIVAAMELGVINKKPFHVKDFNQIPIDLGIKIMSDKKEKFLPIIERNSFWWQKHSSKIILLGGKIDKSIIIPIYSRDMDGEINYLDEIELDGLPNRPRGTTRISMNIQFDSFNEISFTAKDLGFGEMFPSSEYEKKVNIHIRGDFFEMGRI